MSSVNRVFIVGRLGQDPQVRQFDNGGQVANLSIATSEKWTDKNTGEQKEQTEWHKVTLYNRLAEIAGQYLKKGALVYVEGSLHTRKYTDQQGIERYSTEIKAQSMQMLGSRTDGGQAPQANNGYLQQPQGQWGSPAPQGYPQGQQSWSSLAPQHQAPPSQGQQYQTINGHPTTTPVGQPMPVTLPAGQVPDEDMPF